MSSVRVCLQVESDSETTLDAWAIQRLEDQGYSVRPPNEQWETGSEFCARHHIHSETLRRHAENPDRPNVLIRRGESGRILEVLTNADFDAFVIRNKGWRVDRRDHAARMRKRRAVRTDHIYKPRSVAEPPKNKERVGPVTTAKNWKPNAKVDKLLRAKAASDRVHGKVGAQ